MLSKKVDETINKALSNMGASEHIKVPDSYTDEYRLILVCMLLMTDSIITDEDRMNLMKWLKGADDDR